MIGFASIFLGLVLGAVDVDLVVGPGVARAQLYLDGERAGEVLPPDWRLTVDLGPGLLPHELVAVALDANGKELARARQRINRPRLDAEASLVLERDASGRVRDARLMWQCTTQAAPQSLNVTFDGQPLPVADPHRFELPAHVPEQVHFLRAELDFAENVSAVAELTFGGRYRDEAVSELTPVVLSLNKGKKLPPPDEMSGWLHSGEAGEGSARVVAVEEGPAELTAVVDESAREPLERLLVVPPQGFMRVQGIPRLPRGDELRFAGTLRREQRLRVISPYAQSREHSGFRYDLFPRTEDFESRDGGVLWLLARTRRSLPMGTNQRLADAVAVAALSAAGRDRRRATLLVLGPSPQDESAHHVAAVREYLASLGVPLYVWTVGDPAPDALSAWGGGTDVSTVTRFESAVSQLGKDLERERVVWVEGLLLPHRISLSSKAQGVELAR